MMDTQALAYAFCAWPLPATVRPDPCVMMPDYAFPRYGTNLLTVAEAKAMFDHLVEQGLLTATSRSDTVTLSPDQIMKSMMVGSTAPAPWLLAEKDAVSNADCSPNSSRAAEHRDTARSNAIENEAERVYNTWSDQLGFVPWVPHGNSDKQMEARFIARTRSVDPGAYPSQTQTIFPVIPAPVDEERR